MLIPRQILLDGISMALGALLHMHSLIVVETEEKEKEKSNRSKNTVVETEMTFNNILTQLAGYTKRCRNGLPV
jgi:hypothetical protein